MLGTRSLAATWLPTSCVSDMKFNILESDGVTTIYNSDIDVNVPGEGLEPSCLAACDFESHVSTISPPRHVFTVYCTSMIFSI